MRQSGRCGKKKELDEFDSETQDAPAIVEETVPDGCEAARTNIPGSVWKVLVEDGQKVREGDTLVILESMKMGIPGYGRVQRNH